MWPGASRRHGVPRHHCRWWLLGHFRKSSSFRYGAFDATINWIEIVLANGDVTRAYRTKAEKTDLFWGAASAFGTLGVVTPWRCSSRMRSRMCS